MVDNIRDLVDLWLIVGGMGVAIFTYGLGEFIFYEPPH